jgi:molybdate transport system substrate-binding protein
MTLKRLLLPLLLLLTSIGHSGEALHIAVASSFRPTLDKLVFRFQQQSGIDCVVSSAATGVLYAQIVNGAGFDLLLAADSWRPTRLIEAGYARSSDRYSYALGKLILVGAKGVLDEASAQTVTNLLTDKQPRIAIANPATAPYGLASRQSLEQLQLWTATEAQRVTGQNAAQAFQFFTTGNSDFAFASLAQWRNWKQRENSSYWLLPPSFYQPLRHDALVLSASKQRSEAERFMQFLLSDSSTGILREDGYGAPSNT